MLKNDFFHMFHIFFGESGWIWLLPHVLKGFAKKIIFERFFPWKVAKNWHFQRKIQGGKNAQKWFFSKILLTHGVRVKSIHFHKKKMWNTWKMWLWRTKVQCAAYQGSPLYSRKSVSSSLGMGLVKANGAQKKLSRPYSLQN